MVKFYSSCTRSRTTFFSNFQRAWTQIDRSHLRLGIEMYQTVSTHARTAPSIQNPNISPRWHLSSTKIVSRIPLPPPIKTWGWFVQQRFGWEGISIVEILNCLTNLGGTGFHHLDRYLKYLTRSSF